MLGLKRGTVALRPHEPGWDAAAAQTVRQLRQIFGPTAADIQHVGSTSIPAISAKPILDIAVAVRSLDAATPLLPDLEARGFHYRPQCGNAGEMLLVCGDFSADTRTHHIHIVTAGSAEWQNYLNFRDYLRAFPEKARAYQRVKESLAQQFPRNREAYTAGKAALIEQILRDASAWTYLGKTVTVTIDRPAGFLHNSGGHTLRYPINYGFLPGVSGGDGEELDVYILGVSRPLTSFTGRVVGIVHRRDDVEDKLVAAPKDLKPNQAEIAAGVNFAEQYFDSWVEPLYHRSCGAIIYRLHQGAPELLLLRQKISGSWSFPKGHMEPGETEQQTALREIAEETGLSVALREDFRAEMHYASPPRFDKTVVLFLAETVQEPVISQDEISASRWVSFQDARVLLRGNCDKILQKAEQLLETV